MILTIANQKGGVGKTTLTALMGQALATRGKSTLLVDMDPQSSLTELFALDPELSIADVLIGERGKRRQLRDVIVNVSPNLDLVPSNVDLSFADLILPRERKWETRLSQALATVAGHYDEVIVDAPPNLGALATLAMFVDKVVVPTTLTPISYRGTLLYLETLKDVQQDYASAGHLAGVVITIANQRLIVAREVKEKLEMTTPVFKTVVPNLVAYADPLTALSKPTGRPALTIDKLIEEIYA